jgi:hypothetical protein
VYNEGIVLIADVNGDVEGNTVRNNVLRDCRWAGVSLAGSKKSFGVLRNIVEGNQILATHHVPPGDCMASNSNTYNWLMVQGILLAGHRNIIRGNYLYSYKDASGGRMCVGIRNFGRSSEFPRGDENLVEANFVEGTQQAGIQASGYYSKYIGNTVKNCGNTGDFSPGMEARDGYSMLISQNHIMNSPADALLLYDAIHGTAVHGNKTDKLLKFGPGVTQDTAGVDIWENQVIKEGSGNRYQGEATLGNNGEKWVSTWAFAGDASEGHVELWLKEPNGTPGALFVKQICRLGCPTYCDGNRPCFQVKSTNQNDRSTFGWRIVK